jgi:hypothetical protein
MAIIRYTNKGFIREHPFADPISLPAPVQTHSFIYPGDEIVAYHKLDLPGDAGASVINDVKLVSAKVSIIAYKNNPYSEEYSREYQAVRTFILDSFSVSFNNANLINHPWGSDGYAPEMLVTQNRDFKLPLNDFRRKINFFTKHTATASTWQYWFYFPFIFRWEYWTSLLGADVDFFDTSLPQNGWNNLWLHYFNAKWKIKSRLELNVLVNGVPTLIRNDLNLTPNSSGDLCDYGSNPDWINEAIKTCEAGGTPSNTPALIYGNRYTEVHGYFEKNSAWDLDEQGNIYAVLWIEPFEGAGRDARSRASSLYPIANDSVVFAGVDTSLVDSNGLGIEDSSGNFIVINPAGQGVLVWFNATSPEKVEFFGLIDYNKLQLAFPGVRRFTVYARLYNTTLDGGETKQGEEIKQDCILVNPVGVNSGCDLLEPKCPFDLNVFADLSDADDLKNDKSDFYQYGDNLISAIEFTLQKSSNTCADLWEDKQIISDLSLGKFFPFGKNPDFSDDDFEDDYGGKKYTGLLLEWRKVLLTYQAGTYRIKIKTTDIFANDAITYDPRIFCLKNYNCNLVNGTVRLEFTNTGLRGTLDNKSAFIDYAGGWHGEIRLKGIFSADKKPNYKEEYVEYGDADYNALKPYIAELMPSYSLELKPIPGWADRYLENYFLLADEKLITDYNNNNINPFVKFPVVNNGGFESRRQTLAASERLAACTISLKYGQNNLRKRNSQ